MKINQRVGILVPPGANDYELAVFNLILKEALNEYVLLVSLGKQLTLELESKMKISCNEKIETSNLSKFNHLILLSSNNLQQEKMQKISFLETSDTKILKIDRMLTKFFEDKEPNKFFYAINTSSKYLYDLNLINEYRFTWNTNILENDIKNLKQNENIVIDKNLITAKTSYNSIELALLIVENIFSKQKADEIKFKLFNI